MPPDTSDIDAALVAKLGSDLTLLSLMPNGVHIDYAPQGSTRYVIVSLVGAEDTETFEGRAIEDKVYLVKAVGHTREGLPLPDMKGAAARIDALLERGTLTVAGYELMTIVREQPIRPPIEVDATDPAIRWQHRGGLYRVVMST
jgi:hypothetical protein